MTGKRIMLTIFFALTTFDLVRADIYRWDNGQPIPGTTGITLGPGVQLDHLDLAYASLDRVNLTGATFRASNLSHAHLYLSWLTDADLSAAVVADAVFHHTTDRGFTREQLYSTASYHERNLQKIGLTDNDLAGWDFSGQDLTSAYLDGSTLTDANFSGAVVADAWFHHTTDRGFTREQLYSTASYRQQNLQGIVLTSNDLTGWDFSGHNLANARFSSSNLSNANVAGANLTYADFGFSTLTNANFAGANVTNASMTGVVGSRMESANFSGADLRGAQYVSSLVEATTHNTILPAGKIAGLRLAAGERLVVHDYHGHAFNGLGPVPITVLNTMNVAQGATLQLVFEQVPWDSTISFGPGIPIALGGTLELTFSDEVDVASQVGRTLRVFDWSGVNPTGSFQVVSSYAWDTSRLYSTGEISLRLPGDANGDRTVDRLDVAIIARNYGQASGADWAHGDFNQDGRASLADLSILQRYLTEGSPIVVATVPEPSSFGLALLTLATATVLALTAARRSRPAT